MFFDDGNFVEWHEETGFAQWNAYRGDLALLKSSGIYTQDAGAVPLATQLCGLGTPIADAGPALLAGEAVFFLVTGMAGLTESDLGTDSLGALRPNDNPCP